MDILNELLKIIKEKNGGKKLDLKKYEYHLFLNDAHVTVHDNGEDTIKVDVEMLNGKRTKVLFANDVNLEELM